MSVTKEEAMRRIAYMESLAQSETSANAISNLEVALAALLGWTEIQVGGTVGTTNVPDGWLTGFAPGSESKLWREFIPGWTRSNEEACRLMLRYGRYPYEEESVVVIRHRGKLEYRTVVAAASTLEQTVREAIVIAVKEAVIQELRSAIEVQGTVQ